MSNNSGSLCNQEGNGECFLLDTQIIQSFYSFNCTVFWRYDEKHPGQVLFPRISLPTSFTAVVLLRLPEISDKFPHVARVPEMLKIYVTRKIVQLFHTLAPNHITQRVWESRCTWCCMNVQRESRIWLRRTKRFLGACELSTLSLQRSWMMFMGQWYCNIRFT